MAIIGQENTTMDKTKDLFYGPQFKGIARELSKLAIALDIDVEREGVGERIVKNDDSVCGRKNEVAFRKLREHMIGLYSLEAKSLERLNPAELRTGLDQIWGAVLAFRKGDYESARASWEQQED